MPSASIVVLAAPAVCGRARTSMSATIEPQQLHIRRLHSTAAGILCRSLRPRAGYGLAAELVGAEVRDPHARMTVGVERGRRGRVACVDAWASGGKPRVPCRRAERHELRRPGDVVRAYGC